MGKPQSLAGILSYDPAAIFFGQRLEIPLQDFLGMRPGRGLVRIVGRPHEVVDTCGEVPITSQTFGGIDESSVNLAGEILTGFE